MQSIIDFLRSLYNAERLLENGANAPDQLGRAWLAGLAGIIFAETGLLAGFFLPGDSLLFSVGVASGAAGINIYLVGAMLMAAAIIGDNLGYYLGYRTGPVGSQPPEIAFLSSRSDPANGSILRKIRNTRDYVRAVHSGGAQLHAVHRRGGENALLQISGL